MYIEDGKGLVCYQDTEYPEFKTKPGIEPYNYQIDVIRYLLKNKYSYLYLWMGLGKTFCCISAMNALNVKKVLVVSPKAVMQTWQDELEKFSTKPFNCVLLNKGTVAQKTKLLEKEINLSAIKKEMLVGVITYESSWRTQIKKKSKIIDRGILLKTNWDVVIWDESQKLSAPGSKQSFFSKSLGAHQEKNGGRKWELSGTPMNSPLNIYAQYRALDISVFGHSFNMFKNRYAITQNMGNYNQVIGFQNLDELNKKFYSRAIKVTKDEAGLNLPKETHITIPCELDKKTQKIYKELAEEFVAEVKENEDLTAANALVKLLKLSQLTGGYIKYDSGNEEVIDNNKLDACFEIIENLPEREPIIIFTRFKNELKRIKERTLKIGRTVSELSGSCDELQEWKNGETDILCVNMASGSAGINLTRSCYCIYFSIGFSLLQYTQSLARTLRIGQERPVTYYHILAKNTIDQYVKKSIENKKDIVDSVLEIIKNQ